MLALAAITPLLAFGVVSAESSNATGASDDAQTTQVTATSETENESEPSEDSTTKIITPEQKKAALDRIQERKEELKTKLTVAKEERIQARCESAQGKLSSLSGRITGLETSRTQVYANLMNRLSNVQDRLQAQGVDTTELDANIQELQKKIDAFNTSLQEYKTIVGDVTVGECADDAEGFQASIDAARTALKGLREESVKIREYLKGTVKQTLQTIREQVQARTADQANEGQES